MTCDIAVLHAPFIISLTRLIIIIIIITVIPQPQASWCTAAPRACSSRLLLAPAPRACSSRLLLVRHCLLMLLVLLLVLRHHVLFSHLLFFIGTSLRLSRSLVV